MKLRDIIPLAEGRVLTSQIDMDMEISCVAGCDLMSDVLAYARPYSLLLTGLTNAHVVRTAEMADIAAVIFVRGKLPPPETVALAEEKGVPLVSTPYTMFELCGRLYEAGLVSCDVGVRS